MQRRKLMTCLGFSGLFLFTLFIFLLMPQGQLVGECGTVTPTVPCPLGTPIPGNEAKPGFAKNCPNCIQKTEMPTSQYILPTTPPFCDKNSREVYCGISGNSVNVAAGNSESYFIVPQDGHLEVAAVRTGVIGSEEAHITNFDINCGATISMVSKDSVWMGREAVFNWVPSDNIISPGAHCYLESMTFSSTFEGQIIIKIDEVIDTCIDLVCVEFAQTATATSVPTATPQTSHLYFSAVHNFNVTNGDAGMTVVFNSSENWCGSGDSRVAVYLNDVGTMSSGGFRKIGDYQIGGIASLVEGFTAEQMEIWGNEIVNWLHSQGVANVNRWNYVPNNLWKYEIWNGGGRGASNNSGYMRQVCRGVSEPGAATPTPGAPTVTPTAGGFDAARCEMYSACDNPTDPACMFRSTQVAVGIVLPSSEVGECFDILPAFGPYPIDVFSWHLVIGWSQFEICPNWITLGSTEIMGFTLPLSDIFALMGVMLIVGVIFLL